MSKFYWYVCTLTLLSLFLTSASVQTGQAKQTPSRITQYNEVLSKSSNDSKVQQLIAENNCVIEEQLITCKTAGMDLWMDSHQIVKTVTLYLNHADDFSAYQGELPFELKFYDNLQAVEYKLNRQGVRNGGLPDQDSFSYHFQYWALYRKQGLLIVYNSPFADDDNASIYAIVISD